MLCANVTDLRSSLVASYIMTQNHFLCLDHIVDERPESLQETSARPQRSLEVCALSLLPFCLISGLSPFSRGFRLRNLLSNTRNFSDTSNLLDNPGVESLFIIFTLFWGVVRRAGPYG